MPKKMMMKLSTDCAKKMIRKAPGNLKLPKKPIKYPNINFVFTLTGAGHIPDGDYTTDSFSYSHILGCEGHWTNTIENLTLPGYAHPIFISMDITISTNHDINGVPQPKPFTAISFLTYSRETIGDPGTQFTEANNFFIGWTYDGVLDEWTNYTEWQNGGGFGNTFTPAAFSIKSSKKKMMMMK